MTYIRTIIIAGLGLGAAIYFKPAIVKLNAQTEQSAVVGVLTQLSNNQLAAAVKAHNEDELSHLLPVIPEIPLQSLISGGYLRVDDVGILRNMNVTLATSVQTANPRDVFVRVHLHNGSEIQELADGTLMAPIGQ